MLAHRQENHEVTTSHFKSSSFETRAPFAPFATASPPLGLLGCARSSG
jgi:hypothetical protein